MSFRLKLVIVTATLMLVAVLLVGQVVGRTGATPQDTYRHIGVFTEVLSRIKSEYVEEPDMKMVTQGAINGLLESIDPYASYLNKDQYEQYQKHKGEKRPDVGLILSKRFGYISVVDAVPGSPADKAGMGTGDMIETIAGVSTRDMPLAFAEILLQGDNGSNVDLSVIRVRKPEPQKVTLTRTAIKYPAVTAKLLADGVGHLALGSLEEGKSKEVAEAVKSLSSQGAKKLVLDLRNAASGPAEEGVALANLFLEKGLITYLQGQRTEKKEFSAAADKTIWKGPLVVITNRGTASGAELAAAAILDNNRGKIVGERTYGDAALRRAVTMEDGGAVILAYLIKLFLPERSSAEAPHTAPLPDGEGT